MAAVAATGAMTPPTGDVSRDVVAAPGRLPLRTLVRLLSSVGALLCAFALPFAPVLSPSATVDWDASRGNTTVLFTPYRAAELQVTVPDPVVRAALAAPTPTLLLATAPPANPHNAMVLAVREGRLELLFERRGYPLALPPGGGCDLRVESTARETTVACGDRELLRQPGDHVPEVFAFLTDVQDSGLTVTAATRSWFESTPTRTKQALLGGWAVLLAIGLLTLVPALRSSSHPQTPVEPATARATARVAVRARLRPRALVDAAVITALTWWTVVGPLTDDDGFAQMTIRNGAFTGDIGNYYRWFNASEAPFTLLQHIFQPLVALSLSPVFLRVPSVLLGIATWVVVSRGVLGAMLPEGSRTLQTRALAAVALLAWWLPYDLGLRPESFVALGSAAVLALLLRVRSRLGSSRPVLHMLAAAAGVAGATLAITPSGLLAVALFLVFAPTVLAALRPPGGAPRTPGALDAAAGVALLGACAAVFVVAVFADMTLSGVLRATEVHKHFGPNYGWYEDLRRYEFLLSPTASGSATKRLPVLMALVLLPAVAVLCTRSVPGDRLVRGVSPVALATGAAFVVLAFSPSKWSHHFGALAGVGAPLLVGGVLLVGRAARSETRDRTVVACGLLLCGALAGAAGLAFSGPNTWWLYSAWEIAWADQPVRPAGLPFNSPLLWLLVGVVGALVVGLLSPRARRRADRWPAVAAASPVVVAVAALTASVLVLLGSFSGAAAGSGGYTPGRANLASVRAKLPGGDSSGCGLQDRVQVLPLSERGVLQPSLGTEQSRGFTRDSGLSPALLPFLRGPQTEGEHLWGSLAAGAGSTGELITPWFPVAGLAVGQELGLWLSGRANDGNSLQLEFGQRAGTGARPLATRELSGTQPIGRPPFDDPVNGRRDDGRDYARWRLATLPASEMPADADLVRIRAVDGSGDPDGWLAVSGPTVRGVVGLDQYLGQAGRVLLDWPMPFAFPCRDDFPVVRGGLAQTPRVVLVAPRPYQEPAYLDEGVGGVFAGLNLTTAGLEIPSRLPGGGPDEWGSVRLVYFRGELDDYTTRREVQRVAGYERGLPYPFAAPR